MAIKTVPFYKKRNLKINFDNFSLAELNKFPIVDKNIIQKNLKDFFSTKHTGVFSHTSGSTGQPFEFKIGYSSESIRGNKKEWLIELWDLVQTTESTFLI